LGDIGATNARFATLRGAQIGPITSLNVRDFATPVDALRVFLAAQPADFRPTRAAFAGAGPLLDGRITMTNAPWTIDGAVIDAAFGWSSTVILNDFAALAWSLPALTAADIRPIGGGRAVAGAPLAVLGPGTGFGVAGLVRGRAEEIVLVTEGGHATLAGVTDRDDAIIAVLRRRFGHVSVERALSGGGLEALCDAVTLVDGLKTPTRDAADVVLHALAGDCAASVAALELFCAWLGSVAGNVALTLGARGGVYIAGGMVPRFVDFLARSPFRARFEGKGRLASYLAAIPTAVIVHPHPAFPGLARLVARHAV
jgi:glucokinase